jgi:hypothetical protein
LKNYSDEGGNLPIQFELDIRKLGSGGSTFLETDSPADLVSLEEPPNGNSRTASKSLEGV